MRLRSPGRGAHCCPCLYGLSQQPRSVRQQRRLPRVFLQVFGQPRPPTGQESKNPSSAFHINGVYASHEKTKKQYIYIYMIYQHDYVVCPSGSRRPLQSNLVRFGCLLGGFGLRVGCNVGVIWRPRRVLGAHFGESWKSRPIEFWGSLREDVCWGSLGDSWKSSEGPGAHFGESWDSLWRVFGVFESFGSLSVQPTPSYKATSLRCIRNIWAKHSVPKIMRQHLRAQIYAPKINAPKLCA